MHFVLIIISTKKDIKIKCYVLGNPMRRFDVLNFR